MLQGLVGYAVPFRGDGQSGSTFGLLPAHLVGGAIRGDTFIIMYMHPGVNRILDRQDA